MKNTNPFTAIAFVALLLAGNILFSGQLMALETQRKTLHDFVVYDIFGDKFDLSTLKGKKVMVVNTASRCGLTRQFQELEELYRTYQDRGFVVIGFPANNFMNQEPGTNEEILEFCQQNFGVTFPMMSKISVRGDDMAPVYQWLTQKSLNGVMDAPVAWNFQKFLIDEEGRLVEMIPPREKPDSERVIRWIENQ
ncbi:MAG TPA: glutathione peroxidase [Bacteroidales bacterium]|nr:glutathione peroxidase [Bacteroidales bacterium]